MLEFRDVLIEDRERINDFLICSEEYFCDFTFGNLFCWAVVENTKIAFLNNFLFIRFSDDEKFYYTFPLGDGDLKNAINLIFEDAKINNKKMRFVCLTKKQTKILKEIIDKKIKIKENRNSFDYVYSVENLSSLKGRKYHSKKNHFNSFQKKYDFKYEKINKNNISECLEFINEWYEANEKSPMLINERRVLMVALDNFFKLDFVGAVIKLNEKIIAFCAGEKITDDIFCTHFEKASAEFQNSYTAINKLFSEFSINNFKYVNREDDAGIEGLRKAKLSYHPEFILEKYYAEFCD